MTLAQKPLRNIVGTQGLSLEERVILLIRVVRIVMIKTGVKNARTVMSGQRAIVETEFIIKIGDGQVTGRMIGSEVGIGREVGKKSEVGIRREVGIGGEVGIRREVGIEGEVGKKSEVAIGGKINIEIGVMRERKPDIEVKTGIEVEVGVAIVTGIERGIKGGTENGRGGEKVMTMIIIGMIVTTDSVVIVEAPVGAGTRKTAVGGIKTIMIMIMTMTDM